MSFTAPYRASAQPRRTPLATPSLETPRTDRASVSIRPAPSDHEAPVPEPHWQASIESATD